MKLILVKLSYFLSLLIPPLFAKVDYGILNISILIGLFLQTFLGFFLFFYVKGYEKKSQSLIYLGYSILFFSLSGVYLSEKSLWLLFFWELSTISTVFIFMGGKLSKKALSSIVALFVASGASMIFLEFWVFSPENSEVGNYCFLIGILLKSAFSGLHSWLPEAHSGPPSHGSAVYSGLLVNLPILLFFRNAQFLQQNVFLLQVLILVAGLGVFLGGITSFFNHDIKKSLAYSTVENMNLIWLLLFLYSYFYSLGMEYQLIRNAFLFLFFLALVHHSISKVFQFLSFGYIVKVAGTTSLNLAKGFGRISELSFLASTIGTLSFCAVPGTLGFLSEGTFLYLASLLLDLPISQSVFILPSLIFISIGLTFGAASHLRLYLSLILSIPRNYNSASTPNKTVSTTLELLGLSIFILPVLFWILSSNYISFIHPPDILKNWFDKAGILSLISFSFLVFIYYFVSGKITKRVTWDCGSNYKETDVSIPASVISDPLYDSFGRYMNYENGDSKIDFFLFSLIRYVFQKTRGWVEFTKEAELSTYLFISALSLLFAIAIVILFSGL